MVDALVYYKRQLLNTQEVPALNQGDGDSLFNDIVLSVDENYLLLTVTEQQYIQMLSALLNGAYTTYPENYLNVIYPLIKAGKVTFCDAILDCIENNQETRDAITNLINNQSYEDQRGAAQEQNIEGLQGGSNPLCDLDILFGQALQLVEYIDAVNVDILEIIEVLTNPAEMILEIIGDVTGVDETSIDAFFSWISKIQDSIAENYLAQVTETYKEAIACEIFCRAKDSDCNITAEMIFDIFKERLQAQVTLESLIWETLNYLATGAWSGTEIADFMFLSQMAIRGQVGRLLNHFAYTDMKTRLVIYANDPNPDWSVLCECSEVYLITFDTLSDADWNVSTFDPDDYTVTDPADLQNNEQGNPVPASKSGDYFVTGQPSNIGFGNFVQITLSESKTVISVSLEYWWIQDPVLGTSNVLGRSIEMFDENDNLLHSTATSANNAVKEEWTEFQSDNVSSIDDVKYIQISLRRNGTNPTGYSNVWLDNVEIQVS